MKQAKFLVSLTICGVVLAGGYATFAQTTVGEGENPLTQGSVKFKDSTDIEGETIKPEVPGEVITPETGSGNKGLLRIQHVPDFNFGVHAYEMTEQVFNPANELYTKKVENDPSSKHAIPQFIQITDARGVQAGWKLDVNATVFEAEGKANLTLPTTKIVFEGQKLSNDKLADIADRVTAFDTAGLELGTDNKTLMETVTDKTTQGSITSLVLNNTYSPGTVYPLPGSDAEAWTPEMLNTGVKLVKGSSDTPQVGEVYKSIITWTLASVK